MSSMVKHISFSNLVPGSEGVRYTDLDGVPFMCVRDIIMVICDQDGKHADKIWRELPERYKDELGAFWRTYDFQGLGQSLQLVIPIKRTLKLIM